MGMHKKMTPFIRRATLKDLSQIGNLYREYQKEQEKLADVDKKRWQLSEKTIIKFIKNYISDKNKTISILTNDDTIIGFIFGHFEKEKNNGTIDEIYIIPKMRGRGFSSKLKDEFIKWFKEKKQNKKATISLYTMPKNIIAQKAYKKWGFQVSDLKLVKEIK